MPLSPRLRSIITAALLVAVTAAAFSNVLRNQFVDWDDRNEIFGNTHFNPVTLANLGWNWTHTQLSLYMPVTYMVWGAVAAIAPRDPAGILEPAAFHGLNLALHLLCSILVFFLLRQLWHHDGGALVGSLVFAVHPLQAEAVCWASGMYTLLSTACCLAAIMLYVHARRRRQIRDGSYLSVLCFFAATLIYVSALLTKAASVSLPLVAGVIDYFLLQGRGMRHFSAPYPALRSTSEPGLGGRSSLLGTVGSLWLWVLLGIPIVLLAKSFQNLANVPVPPVWGRPMVALDAIGFYLAKLVLPRGLIPDYGRNPDWVMSHLSTVAGPAGIAIVVLVTAWLARQRAAWITTGIGVFVAGVGPYLGLTTFDFQYVSTVSDRYAYFGMVGVAMLACGAAIRERGAMIGLLIACLAWAVLSFGQVRWWHDTDTLFTHTLAVNPNSLVSHNVLGYEAAHSGRPIEAEQWYRGALAIWPADATIWFNLGNLHQHNDPQAAIREYRQAIHYLPNRPDFHKNLAATLLKVGNFKEAFDEYSTAAALDPTDAESHYGLANLFEAANDNTDAIKEYQATLKLDHAHPGARESVKRLTR